jgi:predicted unusual protein kinase regulating ubiquinone biosynthesis (AarF/ABC1/UbiB family)
LARLRTDARPRPRAAQWAATRADLFPPDMCLELTSLQSDAPSHSFAHTRRTVERAFGQPLEVRRGAL